MSAAKKPQKKTKEKKKQEATASQVPAKVISMDVAAAAALDGTLALKKIKDRHQVGPGLILKVSMSSDIYPITDE